MRTISKEQKREALSTTFIQSELLRLKTPGAMLAWLDRSIVRHGYTIHKKAADGFKPTMTTTLPKVREMWLAHNWDEKPIESQIVVKAHELVHIMQDMELGSLKYVAKYANAQGRWVIEMQAYIVGIIVGIALGRDMSGEPERVAESMWKNYKPWWLFRKKAITGPTIEVLSQALHLHGAPTP